MKIYVLSLGQIVKSNLNKSIEEFAKLKTKNSYFPFFLNKFFIQADLLIDALWYKSIDQYKTGILSNENFRKKLISQTGLSSDSTSDEDFDIAWNAMCEISEENLKKAANLIEKVKSNADQKLLIFSSTNELQHNYIKHQINCKLEKMNSQYRFEDDDIVTSFDKKSLSPSDLVINAITNSDLYKNQNNFIVLHNKVQLDLKHAEVQYIQVADPVEYICQEISKKQINEGYTTTNSPILHVQRENERAQQQASTILFNIP